MMLELHNISEEQIKKIFDAIVIHHDILRAIVKDDSIYIRKINEGTLYDYAKYHINKEEAEVLICNIATDLQSSINLNNGPLVKLALFDLGDVQHLLIIIHHLVVDGVSWRILLEDFSTSYTQLLENKPITLPLKTTSYLEWAHKLKAYAQTNRLDKEIKYWAKVNELIPIGAIPHELNNNMHYIDLTFSLDKETTTKLLTEATTNYNVGINEILLVALGMAVQALTNQKLITIEMEGHGREHILEDVVIDRSVGWFTSIYPIVLNIEQDIARNMAFTKELLHNIPHNGFNYNLLKYLRNMPFNSEIDMSFNYLGEFEEGNETHITFSHYSCGNEIAEENYFGRPLAFDGLIRESELCFTLSYDAGKYTSNFVNKLIENYRQILYNIAHQTNTVNALHIASDYGFEGVSLDEFDDMLSAINSMIGE